MLRYLAMGQRRFGLYPFPIVGRLNWEFYAALKGSIGPVMKDAVSPPPSSRTLWIFSPEVPHGWTGEKRKPATIACFHFGMVPQPLALLVRKRSYLKISLSEEQVEEMQNMTEELIPHYESPNPLSLLHYEKALLDLTLIALSSEQPEVHTLKDKRGEIKVEAALAWYAKHLQEQPKIDQVAGAIGLSRSSQQRLFWKCRKQSPHQAFIEVKMQHAIKLMSQSDLKLEAVAASSGFTSATDFSRAFRKHFGMNPAIWRKTQLQPYTEEASRKKHFGMNPAVWRKIQLQPYTREA